jgi:uncharacterized UBP type Zn finger protein
MAAPGCPHAATAMGAEPQGEACQDCGAGSSLRACLTCGRVSCCESQMAHNRAHAEASGHPLIRPLPPAKAAWTWCYACRAYV